MVATLLLIVLVLTAAATDAARHRIYNWTTYPGILAGLALAAMGTGWEWMSPEVAAQWRPLIGWVGLTDALAGLLVCGCLMIFCFVFFPTGGGDVKLLAMVGTLVGLEKGLEILLWTFIFGGCLGLMILIWRMGPLAMIKRTWQVLVGVLTLGIVLPTSDEKQKLQSPVFLGPCAAFALLAALVPWPGFH